MSKSKDKKEENKGILNALIISFQLKEEKLVKINKRIQKLDEELNTRRF